jgi:UPF0755 protein
LTGRTVAGIGLAGGLLLLALFAIAYAGMLTGGPGGAAGESVEFEIVPGTGFPDICETLEETGLLLQRWPFRLVARQTGADREIRAGWFSLPLGISPLDLLDSLRAGPNVMNRVTIPEGLWRSEVAEILAARLDLPIGEIIALTEDEGLIASLGLTVPTLEGYLFPETYQFPKGTTAREAITHMVRSFQAYFGPEEENRAAALGLSPLELLTLASIIEAEAVLAEERDRISAVFHNRLKLGWKLQADPTIQFARGSRRKLYQKHLEIDSPYNTYLVPALPPGPICSPGKASIDAALHPVEGSQDLFFVAAGEGGRHIFSKSDREHNRARRSVKAKGGKSP